MTFEKIASLKNVEAFRRYLDSLDASPGLEDTVDVPTVPPVDDAILSGEDSPLGQPLTFVSTFSTGKPATWTIGNRWAIHPMEGWDGTELGAPSDLTRRRWRHFALSGAKLVWGGEAAAVRPDGRANPNQLVVRDETLGELERLRRYLEDTHRERFGSIDDFVHGLQLTHSGRFCRPDRKDRMEPRVAYRHPVLDRRFGVADDRAVLTDDEVDGLIGDFVRAACRAQTLGFHFVDIKHCHGYLLHEFLGAHTRPGRYGGNFENRTRILREVVAGIRRDAPGLEVGVRVSVFDMVPFRPDPHLSSGRRLGPGVPEDTTNCLPYRYGFGVDADDPTRGSLEEAVRFLELLRELGIRLVNVSAGSPYYNPHIQRPAYYPPSDGYQPPEDPLVGVVRQARAVRSLKRAFPDLVIVGSALSYLQDYLPHVAQALVRDGWMDLVGVGRMVLSYWDLPADCLEGRPLQKKRLCRTFSDCTTAPRKGLVSGCFPLDGHYRALPDAATMKRIKSGGDTSN